MSGHRGSVSGLLAVPCWCEHTIVHVTPADVRAGQTLTCGSHRCLYIAACAAEADR